MLFNSIEYLFFLPIVFLIYWAIGYARIKDSLKLRLQNAFVVVASYVFYGWWDWRFLILIAFTSFCSWGSGLLIAKSAQKSSEGLRGGQNILFADKSGELKVKSGKLWLWLNVIINLGILAIFKYYDFFVTEFGNILGVSTSSLLLRVILPVGISFYTFQALSYSIDVYRGNIKPTKDIIAFFAFISFFPQLVAGPIERATNLLPQFLQNRKFSYEQGVDGMRQILWGLFKKIVIADNCATYVDQVWSTYGTQSGSTLLLAAVLFTFQIYGDFSGYSDIAIGTAKLFGIRLMRNFNNPYFSRDIAEFWRRWHISLTTWFRDYVYIPLGGSRPNVVEGGMLNVESKKKFLIARNTFIIFLVSGIWHGANWTFLAWGAYHAVLFLPLILLGKNRKYTNNEWKVESGKWKEIFQMFITFGLVVIGWIIFRAETIGQAWEYICGMCDWSILSVPDHAGINALFMNLGLLIMVEWLMRNKPHGLDIVSIPVYARYAIYLVLCFIIFAFGGNTVNFIYFQF